MTSFHPIRNIPILLLILFGLCSSAIVHAEPQEHLPAEVAQALKQAGVPPHAVAIVVQEITAPRPVVRLNAEQPFNPASVIKLLTTYAALEILGPSHTWQTTALSSGQPRNGILAADLIIRGSGDPRLTLEQFWLLLRQLRARGVREIRGNLVLDRHLFAPPDDRHETVPPFDDHPARPYNVTPDALLVGFNSLRIQLIGDTPKASLTVFAEPPLGNLELINTIQPLSANHPCGNWREKLSTTLHHTQGHYQLTLGGHYPLACGEKDWYLNVLPHPEYVEGVFRQFWQELGGTLSGSLSKAMPDGALQPLADIQSPPLAEIIRDINKHSNNVMARQLFLTLGTPVQESDATHPRRSASIVATARLRAWLKQKQLDFPELELENGAGLSRQERISATSLARLLNMAWESPLMPEFIASLPIVGIDGTMKKRLAQTPVAGRAHIKTGTLDGVKTMAGYVLDHRGRWQMVVFLANHPNAAATQATQDALLKWVYQH